MKKGLLFILLMFSGLALHAQTKPTETEKKPSEPTETSKEGNAATSEKEVIKTVPAAKAEHAKPVRIGNEKKAATRPAKVRPARSNRPAVRVIKPGRGR